MADYSDLKNRFKTDDVPNGDDYEQLISLAGDAKDRADSSVTDNGDGTITVNEQKYKPVEDNKDGNITVNGTKYKPVEDNKDNTITVNGKTYVPVIDNQDGTITVNTQTYTPADASKVVKDNKDGSIILNNKNFVPASIDNVIISDTVGRESNTLIGDYSYSGELQDLKDYRDSVMNDSGFKILFVTDLHYGEGTNDKGTADADPYRDYVKGPPLSKIMLKNLRIFDGYVDTSIFNGDIIHGHEGKSINSLHNIRMSSMIRDVLPTTDTFIGIGNHEDGSVWSYQEPILRDELLNQYDYKNNSFGETRLDFCAYKDYKGSKIRIIHIAGYDNPDVFNTDGSLKYPRGSHSVFSQEQIDFITQALSTTPSEYTVVIFNHGPLEGYFGNTPYSSTYNVNHEIVNGILQAFVSKTTYSATGTNSDFPVSMACDFSNQQAILAGVITGHEHRDRSLQTIGGVNSVMRTCFLPADRGDSSVSTATTDADLGTKEQYAFDIIELDTNARKVTFKRFGKGSDYSYDY